MCCWFLFSFLFFKAAFCYDGFFFVQEELDSELSDVQRRGDTPQLVVSNLWFIRWAMEQLVIHIYIYIDIFIYIYIYTYIYIYYNIMWLTVILFSCSSFTGWDAHPMVTGAISMDALGGHRYGNIDLVTQWWVGFTPSMIRHICGFKCENDWYGKWLIMVDAHIN